LKITRSARVLVPLLAVSLAMFGCAADEPEDTAAPEPEPATEPEAPEAEEEEDDFLYPDPNETLTFTVAFSAGGGNDIMSRLIAELLQTYDLWPGNIAVENLEGGSGSRGWGHVHSQTGNPYEISTTSGSFTATPLQADTGWEPTEFTPLALLATDEVVLWVRGDAPWDTLEEFLEYAETTPPIVSGVGATQLDFLAPSAVFSALDLDWEYVSHDGTPEAVTTLLSESADALSRVPGPIMGLYEAGDIKPLAVSGPARLPQLPDTPTFEELGFEIDVTFIRGLVMPPDVDPRVQEWWIDTIAELTQTPEWQEYIESNVLTENLVYGDEFGELIARVYSGFEEALRAEGVID
jgi:putative tricarboxylic transport membrane protein